MTKSKNRNSYSIKKRRCPAINAGRKRRNKEVYEGVSIDTNADVEPNAFEGSNVNKRLK